MEITYVRVERRRRMAAAHALIHATDSFHRWPFVGGKFTRLVDHLTLVVARALLNDLHVLFGCCDVVVSIKDTRDET